MGEGDGGRGAGGGHFRLRIVGCRLIVRPVELEDAEGPEREGC